MMTICRLVEMHFGESFGENYLDVDKFSSLRIFSSDTHPNVHIQHVQKEALSLFGIVFFP